MLQVHKHTNTHARTYAHLSSFPSVFGKVTETVEMQSWNMCDVCVKVKIYIDSLYVYYINIILCICAITNQMKRCGVKEVSRSFTSSAALKSF